MSGRGRGGRGGGGPGRGSVGRGGGGRGGGGSGGRGGGREGLLGRLGPRSGLGYGSSSGRSGYGQASGPSMQHGPSNYHSGGGASGSGYGSSFASSHLTAAVLCEGVRAELAQRAYLSTAQVRRGDSMGRASRQRTGGSVYEGCDGGGAEAGRAGQLSAAV